MLILMNSKSINSDMYIGILKSRLDYLKQFMGFQSLLFLKKMIVNVSTEETIL